MSRFLVPALLCVALFSIAPLGAEEDDSSSNKLDNMFELEAIPPAPANFVHDDARLFKERELRHLSEQLEAFHHANQVTIYVVAVSVLIGEKIDERAVRVRDTWLVDKPGVIVAYERGTERLTFSATAGGADFLRANELEQLFASAYEQASEHERGSTRLIAAVGLLTDTLPSAIRDQAEMAGASNAKTRKFVGWALALVAILAVAGMGCSQFFRKRHFRVTESYSFPRIEVAERFGAPYSGGHQAEIQFSAAPPA